MADMIICDERYEEALSLKKTAKDVNAYISDTRLEVVSLRGQEDFDDYMAKETDPDMAVTSITDDSGTAMPERVRQESDDTSIMLVADAEISPVRYLTPKIRACSLLLRPFNSDTERSTIREFMADHYRRTGTKDGRTVRTASFGETVRIPVSDICYVEARGKKVAIRLRNREYSEYATFENVLDELGRNFVRCHRSFAFNRDFFESVKISDNIIKLSYGLTVPLSRSYKRLIKEFVNETR